MAYMNQERKAKIAAAVKPILKKYKLKGSLRVHHHSEIILTLSQGPIRFGTEDYIQVNQYWLERDYEGVALKALQELKDALLVAGYYNNSDAQRDYFDTAYYYSIHVGKWDKPYQLVA